MIKVFNKGSFSLIEAFLKRMEQREYLKVLDKYGQLGVEALAAATPVDTGETASQWTYEVSLSGGDIGIFWSNNNVNQGVNIAIILQYGHGTGTGGWVEGRDYINPALAPIFDKILEDVWEEVRR